MSVVFLSQIKKKGFPILIFHLILWSYSLWEGVPGQETRRQRPRNAVCNEGIEEGFNCTEEKDSRTYHDGTPSS